MPRLALQFAHNVRPGFGRLLRHRRVYLVLWLLRVLSLALLPVTIAPSVCKAVTQLLVSLRAPYVRRVLLPTPPMRHHLLRVFLALKAHMLQGLNFLLFHIHFGFEF